MRKNEILSAYLPKLLHKNKLKCFKHGLMIQVDCTLLTNFFRDLFFFFFQAGCKSSLCNENLWLLKPKNHEFYKRRGQLSSIQISSGVRFVLTAAIKVY